MQRQRISPPLLFCQEILLLFQIQTVHEFCDAVNIVTKAVQSYGKSFQDKDFYLLSFISRNLFSSDGFLLSLKTQPI